MSGTPYRERQDYGNYVPTRISELVGGCSDLKIEALEIDNCIKDKALLFFEDAKEVLGNDVGGKYSKIKFSYTQNGMTYNGFFATALVFSNNQSQNNMLKGLVNGLGALYGLGKAEADFAKAFDYIMVYLDQVSTSQTLFDNFVANTAYGPGFFEFENSGLQAVNQIKIQGAMQRQDNQIQASQRLSKTLSETSDLVNARYESRSQIMDNMDRKYSEAIRGVNTYSDNSGRDFEASVAYDHVYQKGSTFIGSKDGSLNLGPDWTELKKNFCSF